MLAAFIPSVFHLQPYRHPREDMGGSTQNQKLTQNIMKNSIPNIFVASVWFVDVDFVVVSIMS